MLEKNGQKITICVVGLGYIGLPLAVAFGEAGFETTGFDINKKRIQELRKGIDSSGEIVSKKLKKCRVIFTNQDSNLRKANFIVVTVPTPVDSTNKPDLSLLKQASEMIGKHLRRGSIVVYESTVYPGVTEEVCGSILETTSGLKCGRDFKLGYSPERINPGDKKHTLKQVVKVVSGMDKETTEIVAWVYKKVSPKVYIAPNIKTAEAAKVIENTQRDVNIALMNEFSLIFKRIGVDTIDVLETAATKWNFLKFKPGLVGGHCIGVDPYYLIYRSERLGYRPQLITTARQVNEYMPEFVALETIEGLAEAGKTLSQSKILVLGLTFKENVRDVRNSKIGVTINKLKKMGAYIVAYDPLLTPEEIEKGFKIKAIQKLEGNFDAIILATAHRQFLNMGEEVLKIITPPPVIIDVRNGYRFLRKNKNIIYKNL